MKNMLKFIALAIAIVITASSCDYFSSTKKIEPIDRSKIDTSIIYTNKIDTSKINSNQKNTVFDTLKR